MNGLMTPIGDMIGDGLVSLGDIIVASPLVAGAIHMAMRSVITDFVSDLLVDLRWVEATYGKWFKTALQALIILESFATGLVISIIKMIIAVLVKKAVGGMIGGVSKIFSGGAVG